MQMKTPEATCCPYRHLRMKTSSVDSTPRSYGTGYITIAPGRSAASRRVSSSGGTASSGSHTRSGHYFSTLSSESGAERSRSEATSGV